jgi:membrane protein required for beta-lactamase induction
MNLIALFLGLALERLLTQLLHLREIRWLDGWFDAGLSLLRKGPVPVSWLVAVGLVVIPTLPVAMVGVYFGHIVSGVVYVLFAALVLVFSLGPRDLMAEVDAYVKAVERDQPGAAEAIARGLLENETAGEGGRALESAVVIQANHRIFGVLFWFMLLGPAGAWGYRVADLFRRRSVFQAARNGEAAANHVVQVLFEIVAWLPARLLALTYAVAGSFEDATEDWRRYYRATSRRFMRVSEDVVAAAGVGAIRSRCPEEDTLERVRSATRLVRRSVLIWLTAISLATLVGVAA